MEQLAMAAGTGSSTEKTPVTDVGCAGGEALYGFRIIEVV